MRHRTPRDASRTLYDPDNDLHVRAIDRLVQELGVPAAEVNRTYREQLEEMKKVVPVKAFLPVLVSRAVKDRLLLQR
ncbi:MAG: three-helix bundle dimerization domain-containing protein [Nitrospirota bacterium]